MRALLFLFLLSFLLPACRQEKPDMRVSLPGLEGPVEVVRDSVGVNHIYAQNEHDLFFMQGYSAAKDRLFQFELWRRQATGTVAEILGPRELNRDIGARLFKFRGDLNKEFSHYHPHGDQIIRAFTDGINACISEANKSPEKLPVEFRLLGISPGLWTPEVVISRHQGLLGNLLEEITVGRSVAALGDKKVKELDTFEPGDPIIQLDPKIKKENLFDSVTKVYEAFRRPVRFQPMDLQANAVNPSKDVELLTRNELKEQIALLENEDHSIGSNNWIVSGALSESGYPLLANDPHRALSLPSLRYMVHLQAPGWNVLGGGEPTLPGVSIGHNEVGAWGLTVFAIDGEDIYEYELNPADASQYKYKGNWENFIVIKDTLKVKGEGDHFVEYKFTRHGPVTFIKNGRAYAVRCAWLEPGGAPYLASLRMDQAKTWEEFRDACTYSHIPGENMIWADRNGNIGWQAVGIAPVRKNWSGLVPVPGDGTYEWEGFLPIKDLPHIYNPAKGFWATANENLVPKDYPFRDAVAWSWADSTRANRINEVLGSGQKHALKDMQSLQTDYYSIPARTLIPLLKDLSSPDVRVDSIRQMLLRWNFTLNINSIEAAVYVAWEKKLSSTLVKKMVPDPGKKYIRSVPLRKMINWITSSSPVFQKYGFENRNTYLMLCLKESILDLEKKLGPDISQWQYGQPAYHHVLIRHPFGNLVDETLRGKFQVGPLPRGGYGSTPGMTTNSDNQTAGATFRMVVDTEDWDKAMFTNAPGQSGDPESPFYSNLFDRWARDIYFPVYFSREKITRSKFETAQYNPAPSMR